LNSGGTARRFVLADYAEVIAQLPDDCPIIGGQAVAWWAKRYGISAGNNRDNIEVASRDLDIWGDREELKELASRVGRKPYFPREYEMTVWTGGIELTIGADRTVVEFLHSVPGLDTTDPAKACVEQEFSVRGVNRIILVLTPVSLVLAKYHALRHFDQKDRQGELHLKVCLSASREFISEMLEAREIRRALGNCERLISLHELKVAKKIEASYGFDVLEGVPVRKMESAADDPNQTARARRQLRGFLNQRRRRAKSGN